MKKKKPETTLKGWEEVDQALKEIGEIDRKVKTAEIEMNETISMIKASAEDKTRFLLKRKEELEEQIALFTEGRRDEFKEAKTKSFVYGEVGFRKTTSIITRNLKAIIEALKQNRMDDCIDVTEKLNKEKLAEYDDEALNKVGAKRKTEDRFFLKIAEERLVD